MNIARGGKHIFIDGYRLSEYLDLTAGDIGDLRIAGLIPPEIPLKLRKPPINYAVLAEVCRAKLDCEGYSTHAQLAKSLGISRASVTRALYGFKQSELNCFRSYFGENYLCNSFLGSKASLCRANDRGRKKALQGTCSGPLVSVGRFVILKTDKTAPDAGALL